jgi:DNA-binding response OmpR family regulator
LASYQQTYPAPISTVLEKFSRVCITSFSFESRSNPAILASAFSVQAMALKVLIVDDDQSVREYIRWILQRENFETFEADGGIPGLKIVQDCWPSIDLIITDLQMPNGDGLTFANEVRRTYPCIPIILISGRSAVDSGFPFVEKPFSWAALVGLARKLIGSRARAA